MIRQDILDFKKNEIYALGNIVRMKNGDIKKDKIKPGKNRLKFLENYILN
jgi:hypothetical protein